VRSASGLPQHERALPVDTVDGYMDGHNTGVHAQLYPSAAAPEPYNISGWRNTTRHIWGLGIGQAVGRFAVADTPTS
jgi:hypothetical protein